MNNSFKKNSPTDNRHMKMCLLSYQGNKSSKFTLCLLHSWKDKKVITGVGKGIEELKLMNKWLVNTTMLKTE